MNNIKKYVQVTKPDKMLLAEFLIKAKGKERTMAQMSENCGINTSTLSRIANGKISRPLTIEVLQSIYDNRDIDADLSFEMFLRANGMTSEENVEKFEGWWELDIQKQQKENRKRQAKNAIVTALMARGIVVQKIPNSLERRRTEAPYGIQLPYDFNFYIKDETPKLWYFKMIDEVDFLKAFRIASVFFLLDSWHQNFFNNTKTTFIFTAQNVFYSFVNQYKKAPIKAAFSAMLIDAENEKIVEEKSIPGNNKVSSVLLKPEVGEEGFIASWESDEEYDEFEEET